MSLMLPSTTEVQISRMGEALYSAAAGNTYMNAFVDSVNETSLTDFANWFAGTVSGDSATLAGIVAANLGLTGDAATEGANYLVAMMDANPGNQGVEILNAITLFAGLTDDATYGAAATAYNDTVNRAYSYSMNAANTTMDITTLMAADDTTVLTLTDGLDNLPGTTGDDTFIAHIVDNANTLESGDILTGGTGNDVLSADIGNSQGFAITAETTGIETVQIRAQTDAVDQADNNLDSNWVQIDAQRMEGVNQWESNNSRSDVVIEDVRIGDSQITKDITIAMRETDPGDVDFGVYFDQLSLRNISSSTSSLTLQIMDTGAKAVDLDPLLNSPYGSFTFTATTNGEDQVIVLASDAIQDAQTYEDMQAAMQEALDSQFGAGAATASLDGTFTIDDPLTGSAVTGQNVVITAGADITFTTPDGSGWAATGVVPAASNVYTNWDQNAVTSTALVTSTIILDDVGRGSMGGDLVVGGLSTGQTSDSLGVQRFEITVEDNSELQTINSTNNTLQEVVIVNGDTSNNPANAYTVTEENAGYLVVNGEGTGAAASTDGTATNAELPDVTAQINGFGFSDVRLIDGSAMSGKLSFNSEITTASIGKYLDLTDTNSDATHDNVDFVYSGGSNDDTMSVDIDGAVAAATNTLSGREDFTFTFNGGAGDDSITTLIGGSTANWLADQQENANVSVNGGSGNDTITTSGAGNVVIDAGSGDDTVYTDNTGAKAAWVVNSANILTTDLLGLGNGTTGILDGSTLTVTFAAADGTATTGVTNSAAVENSVGFESTVTVTANATGDQTTINQAIKAAINEDAVLSKLLVAADGPADTLIITSLVDGAFTTSDLTFNVNAITLADQSSSFQSDLQAAYEVLMGDSTVVLTQTILDGYADAYDGNNALLSADINGSGSTFESDNMIDVSTGDDVVVLGTGVNSNDTLVFNGTNQGTVTVVNFDDAAGSSSLDALDFSSYLTGLTSASGSTNSQVDIADTISFHTVDTNASADEVMIINDFASVIGESWADMTAADLLQAIQDDTSNIGYGNISDSDVDVAAPPTDLVGNTMNHILMVENDLNDGEYKVFTVTSDVSDSANMEFTGATLITTLDLGATYDGSGAAAGGDVTAPTLASSSPADGDAAVVAANNLTLTFSETVQAGTGNIVIFNDTTGSADAVIDVTGTLVTFAGDTITIDPATDLVAGDAYHLIVNATAVTDTAGNAYAGIGNATDLNFSVAAAGAGTAVAVTAADAGTTGDATTGDITFTLAQANYAYTVDGFAAGDILDVLDGAALTIANTDGTDGIIGISVADSASGTTVEITLTGVDAAVDATIFNTASFDAAFGAGSLA